MLSPYRVLDLTDERGQLAGATLADLGAEVILVEPPDGSRARRLPPFVAGREGDPEASLWFWSYNRGKRSISLDLDDPTDHGNFLELVAGADIVLESDRPGAMAERGLGYDVLSAVNPGIVMTSISPFGASGPKAEWEATDLTVAAAAAVSKMTGDEDRAPLRVPLPQAFLHASAEAAGATLIALHERNRSGRGQHVDVSAQQSFMQATQSMVLCHLYNSPETTRMSGGAAVGPFRIRLRSPAADGFVSTTILFGEAIAPFSARLFDWIHEEGMCDDSDLEIDWVNFVEGVTTGRIGLGEYDRIQDVAAEFSATKTKAELLATALERRLLVVPICNVQEVSELDQYAERDFWRQIECPNVGKVQFPGPMAKFSATPLDVSLPPPAIGQHNAEIKPRVVANVTVVEEAPVAPLSDVKILDLMWVMAGPAATRVLADWGATVVRVESSHKIEGARTFQPLLNDEGGSENSGLFQNLNAGKLGLTVAMDKPEARDLILDLVRWADVVCESFSPKAMAGWNLTYEDLRAVKPDIIMTSSCLFGQDGPMSELAGFGTMGASMSGFYEMTGWPDRDPAGVMGAYTDYVSPRYLEIAILAALDHRRRTGEGQYIDLSQAEASMNFLTPHLLGWTVNGQLAPKIGNGDPSMAPHGVHSCSGDDEWVAVACENDEQWRSLCDLLNFPADWRGADLARRQVLEEEIDAAIGMWTSTLGGSDVHSRLQAIGVPAHVVQDSIVVAEDPQLQHRNHFREASHDEHGSMWVEGPRFCMSRSADTVSAAAPTLGQHTFDVLEQVLGYDADQIAELAVAGVLE
jgi:crotonobetainyl-CoA:carnitine CoA-transferase CaiB-like acyl-CoA transferase|tara:strand:- start:2578 stop:4998 length:2421 start_codon:yes stop_codon:yes gene_type:complete